MLDAQTFRNAPESVRDGLRRRGFVRLDIVEDVLDLDERRRARLTERQRLQQTANQRARSIGRLMKQGKRAEAQTLIDETAADKARERALASEVEAIEARLTAALFAVPNLPHPSVPDGKEATDNRVVHTHGARPEFAFAARPHWDIAVENGLIDFARGTKVAGSGFPFYVGKGARLQRALIQFFLDQASAHYTEVQPPLLVSETSARGTGQLPDKEGQMYHVGQDNLYLVPTAEVPLTNFFRDEILPEDRLPIKLCAYTPCWRREAGSYGKHVRGLNRLHQFDKVEIVQFTHPDRSYDALETMRSDAERLLRRLGLPYRCLLMCAGELGFNQAKQYDLEVWSAGQERWLEVSSISNFTDYQARRMNIRYRPHEGGKPRLVHTLNGSALALPRIVAALLENQQTQDGGYSLPEVLRPYLAGSASD